MTTAIDNALSAAATSRTGGASDAGSADRFLKLLVTQLQNQDPLNPMDNAELTSQMAQINTVTGIQQLNASIAALHTQFVQMQALQGASLIGRDVTVEGNKLALGSDGKADAGFSLAGPADAVQVEILDGAGKVVDTLQLGAQDAGRHGFEWDARQRGDVSTHSFRVTAKLGSAAVAATPLMLDRVTAVSLDATAGLVLSLQKSGNVPYDDVYALN
jgi:flagellar basal-body rod modification protein FlgD